MSRLFSHLMPISRYLLICALCGPLLASCANVAPIETVKQPFPYDVAVEVLAVLTPDTLVVGVLPTDQDPGLYRRQPAATGGEYITADTLTLKLANIALPMGHQKCGDKWSAQRFAQTVKDMYYPLGSHYYGLPPFDFNDLCQVIEKRFKGKYIGVKVHNIIDSAVLGTAMHQGVNQNTALIRQGYAKVDFAQTHDMTYIEAELQAREKRVGFWATPYPKPVPQPIRYLVRP